jgi:fluoroacetyl-CoA thioesterase
VYSTPSLLYDVEVACRELILPHVGEGKDSVGTRVEFDHVGATLLGMWVEITVTLTEVNGPAVTFEFSARDAVEEVARGKHSRFVVGLEKTAQRLEGQAGEGRVKPGTGVRRTRNGRSSSVSDTAATKGTLFSEPRPTLPPVRSPPR